MKKTEISIECLVDAYFCSALSVRRNSRTIELSIGGKYINRAQAIGIFDIIGVDQYNLTTENLKNKLKEYFSTLNAQDAMRALNHALCKRPLTLSTSPGGQVRWYLSDGSGFYSNIFPVLNFKYRSYNRKIGNQIRVLSGSFFFNGEWLHIDDQSAAGRDGNGIKKCIIDQFGNKYASVQEAARQTKQSAGNISEVLNGRRSNAGGYMFRRDTIKNT